MKSTKVQKPRRIPHIKPININAQLLAAPRCVAVLPGQFSLLCGLAALVCLVWGKAERATHPSRTILHDALNGKTASSNCSCFMPHLLNARAALIGGLG